MSSAQVLSPLPDTFYRKPSPDSSPFKQESDSVAVGDVVGVVEVMKSFHEVKVHVAGSNVRFLVDDGDAIMAGQPLAEVTT